MGSNVQAAILREVCEATGVKTRTTTKAYLIQALSQHSKLSKEDCANVLEKLAKIVASEVKTNGRIMIPNVCLIKTRMKPPREGGRRECFGKAVTVKGRPAKPVLKIVMAKAQRDSI